MEGYQCAGRGVPGGLILMRPRRADASDTADPIREILFAEGFQRMGWPAYDAALIRRTAQGKPVYAGGEPFYFNYSDTKGFGGAVFAPMPAGIDLEGPRRRSAALLKRLPEQEQRYLFDAGDETQREHRFARLWTAKEAFCKMTGTGITKEILETSFADFFVSSSLPSYVFSPQSADSLPAAGSVRIRACGAEGLLQQFYAGSLTVSVCTMEECMFDIAFLESVG